MNLIDAWKNRDKIGEKNKTRELSAFLPAALEIQETPPNPIAKWLGRSLMVLFSLLLLWACIGKVNVVSSAEGKIIPSSRVKSIQPLEKAVVKKILVKEGEYVDKGQALVELDSTLTKSDANQLTGQINDLELKLSIDETIIVMLGNEGSNNILTLDDLKWNEPTSSSVENGVLYKRLLWQKWQRFITQKNALEKNVEKVQAEYLTSKEIVKKLTLTLPIINQRTKKMAELVKESAASESEYLELEQERLEKVQDLAAEKQRQKQLKASQAESKEKVNNAVAQTYTEVLTAITENKNQLASLEEELTKAKDINSKKMLYSPVSGRVQSLAINTVGGVITAAQELMLIVPTSEKLEVEVVLANKDIGFVNEGMAAEVKIHTFPFTKYGIVDAEITHISNDATLDEKQGLIYSMYLVMKKNTLNVRGRDEKLIPGMSVTVEVKTGHRRIIEFFLSPLLRYGQEGLRER